VNIGVVCYASIGGSGIVATELGKSLAARGHSVHVLSSDTPVRLNAYQPGLSFHRVETPSYPLFREPQYVLSLANKIVSVARSERLDIVHAHYAIPHAAAAYLARQVLACTAGAHVPRTVTTLHGTDITLVGGDRSYYPITKFSIAQSNGVTAISDYLRTRTVEVFGDTGEIRVIKNFVNCAIYQPDENKSGAAMFAPAGEKLLIHLSNFRPIKRAADCIRILAEVRKSVPAHLLMVGDGPDCGVCESLARELKVNRSVSFLGKRNHVEQLIPLAHVALMPSELEAFGLVALEAMACGVVPVATRVGGVPELVTDGVDGFLEPMGDIQAQAARVVSLLTDEALHARMAKAGRQAAVERFSTERVITQYEEYYQEVVSG